MCVCATSHLLHVKGVVSILKRVFKTLLTQVTPYSVLGAVQAHFSRASQTDLKRAKCPHLDAAPAGSSNARSW